MKNKNAVLVTGGVRNTGLAVAERFLSEGRTVFISSRDLESAQTKAGSLHLEYGVGCFGVEYDPADPEISCEDLFEEIACRGYVIDTLVCTHAAPGFGQDTLTVELDDWENVIVTNVMGYYMPARMMAKKLIAEGLIKGSIVFISSTVGMDAIPGRSAYVASKGAETSMTKGLALDLIKYGIRVNSIAPGPIRTDRWASLADDEKAGLEKTIPVGEPVSPEQVAAVVAFLAGESSMGMTGTSIVVDGGLDCVVPGAF